MTPSAITEDRPDPRPGRVSTDPSRTGERPAAGRLPPARRWRTTSTARPGRPAAGGNAVAIPDAPVADSRVLFEASDDVRVAIGGGGLRIAADSGPPSE